MHNSDEQWDVVEKDTHTIEDYKKTLDNQLAFMDYYVPILFLQRRVKELIAYST